MQVLQTLCYHLQFQTVMSESQFHIKQALDTPLLNPFTSAAPRIRKFVASEKEKVSHKTENLKILLPDCVNMFGISEQSQRCVNLNT